ncbi:MAG: type II toxin-antitoxin system VapC family toxin [Sphingomonadaceae bacterium]|nr:type II toxin-antitoxin system VapC family toxin [Sphingomonadaceae bacterium]
MRLLLDTHALLWVLEDNPRLSRRAAEALASPDAEKLVSAVSAVEICLKFKLGKLPGSAALAEAFAETIAAIDCTPLPVSMEHAALAGLLDIAHKDPFDRLLIAQARIERAPLVSNEALFDAFGVERIW